eukprot:scaffold272341_cov40-Tisochrysis_lutea.AAC.1
MRCTPCVHSSREGTLGVVAGGNPRARGTRLCDAEPGYSNESPKTEFRASCAGVPLVVALRSVQYLAVPSTFASAGAREAPLPPALIMDVFCGNVATLSPLQTAVR